MVTIRLADVAGPELHVFWLALLVWPVNGTPALSEVPPLVCPGDELHATWYASVSVPDARVKLPPLPDPLALIWYFSGKLLE